MIQTVTPLNPCPTCGTCPTCGRKGYHTYPYPNPYWYYMNNQYPYGQYNNQTITETR